MSQPEPEDFEKASRKKEAGLGREIIALLHHNKRWWLAPILIVIALISVLLILGASGGPAAFIYTLF